MSINKLLLIISSLVFFAASAFAQHTEQCGLDCKCGCTKPNHHAPIGVMADHLHREGELMLSYRFMTMDMDGNRMGTNRVSTAQVLQNYMVSPTKMDMRMHMLGAMYAPTDEFTVAAMLPFHDKSMEHVTRMGGSFETETDGLGDIKLSGLFNLAKDDIHQLIGIAGVSMPTGSIDEKGTTPMGRVQLPYPMQLGSGTWDILPGLTYNGSYERFGWGAQVLGNLKLHDNSNDYRLGNQYTITTWGAYNFSEWISGSLRLLWDDWGNIRGSDPDLNPAIVPTADPKLRGGERLDIGFGANFFVPSGELKNLRLAVEYLVPVYQSLVGPQLETDWSLVAGMQFVF